MEKLDRVVVIIVDEGVNYVVIVFGGSVGVLGISLIVIVEGKL